MPEKNYDLIIIGAGPAGLTASIYASRYNINHLVIGKTMGGLVSESHEIGNWPGEKLIAGPILVKKFEESAKNLGAKIVLNEVTNITKEGDNFLITTNADKNFTAKTILLALGTKVRKLNVPGEKEFAGKGVSYCATCDGPFFKNKIIAVIGGGDAGVTAAIYLSDIAEKVYVIEVMEKLMAEEIWQDKLKQLSNIEIILGNKLEKIEGDNSVKKIILEKKYEGSKELEVEGVFVEIGNTPESELVDKLELEKDKWGYINIKQDGSTNVKGIWAAGDITSGSNYFQQIITACSEGAIAANSIHKYLKI